MGRKALFFDVDGTLSSNLTHTVPDSAVRVLSETRKKGNLVFVNSGRTWYALQEIVGSFEADGYLCGCGTNVIVEGKQLLAYRIPHKQGVEIKRRAHACGLDGLLEGIDGIYYRKDASPVKKAEWLRQQFIRSGIAACSGWDDEDYDFSKFCLFADEKSDREGFFRWLAPDFQVIDRGNDFYEIVPAGFTKGTAVGLVLDYYGIAPSDAYGFGDSSNDLDMFKAVGNVVLMGNHDPVLDSYEAFLTKTVEEDGIAFAMEKLGLV